MALGADKLRVWPFAGPVGLREHNLHTGQADIQLFDQWCHLATVRSDEELAEALQSRPSVLAFDLDSYRLALKYLTPPGKSGTSVIELALEPS
jgi:DNA polymerase-3 subunit epsilon